MKNFMRYSLAACAAIALCGLTTCFMTSCDDDDDNSNVATLKFSASQVTSVAGKKDTVLIKGGTAPYTALTSDKTKATATVKKDTVFITSVKAGTAYILVTSSDKMQGRILVSVKGDELTFSNSTVTVAKDKEATVTIKSGSAPYTATVKDASIATATVNAKVVTVKGLKAGTTTVTVTDKDKKTGVFVVTVK